MKILMANSIRPEVWGGGEKWFLTAAAGLRRRGHEITAAGRRGSLFLARMGAAGHRVEGIRIRLDYGWGSIRRVRRIIRREGIERVLLNVNKDLRTFGVAARRERVPLVACRHGARVFSDRWKDRFSARFVDRIIVNNLALRDEYSRYPWLRGKPVIHLPNGIDPAPPSPAAPLREKFSIPESHLLILAAGRLSFEKGFDLLVSAAARLGSDPPFTVILAGEGPEEERIRR
ncbi:MAG TPA: glycosyltransferase family 4 protein, partial [bacterium]|nr:glycosyltransferase family 4 protein [bacterium]